MKMENWHDGWAGTAGRLAWHLGWHPRPSTARSFWAVPTRLATVLGRTGQARLFSGMDDLACWTSLRSIHIVRERTIHCP